MSASTSRRWTATESPLSTTEGVSPLCEINLLDVRCPAGNRPRHPDVHRNPSIQEELTVYDEVSDEDRSEVSAALAARLAEIRKGLTATLPGSGPDGEIPDHEVRLEAVGKFIDLLKMIQPVRPT